ncbi:MAG: hypothetical protein H7232_02865 [Aeromicrobium sp.]|nr:hypothetical protein [Burkholderiales bacterium]
MIDAGKEAGNDAARPHWRSALVAGAVISTVLIGCNRHKEPVRTSFELTDIDPRSQVIGVVPNDPTDPSRSRSAAAASAVTKPAGVFTAVPTDVSAKQEAAKMPLPGQANDHSTLSKVPSQRSTGPASK